MLENILSSRVLFFEKKAFQTILYEKTLQKNLE